ncbi:hCG1820542 [Homo sapiens]|nr:hCG1820542 [Homo sapiens]|eukprot:NP_001305258.1 uncharacterized protein LOC284898 precursor [Homo sapiens]
MLLEGLTLLLNLNVAGARKQLLSCRRWQGESPQMDFDSKPHSPGLLITEGLDPRLKVDPRAGKNQCELLSPGYVCSQAEARYGGSLSILDDSLPCSAIYSTITGHWTQR